MTPLHYISTLFPYTTLFRSTLPSLCLGAPWLPEKNMCEKRPTISDCPHVDSPHGSFPSRVSLVPAVRYILDVLDVLVLLGGGDRKSTRLNSSHVTISYAVFF